MTAPETSQISVLLPLPLSGCYDYSLPEETCVKRGDFVCVPLGKRLLTGVVWGKGTSNLPKNKIKEISHRIETLSLPEETMKFIEWVAGYTMSPLGAVLKMAFSVPEALLPPKTSTEYIKSDNIPSDIRLTKAREKVLEAISEKPVSANELAEKTGCSVSVIKTLAKTGAIKAVETINKPDFATPENRKSLITLSKEQQKAADFLKQKSTDGFSVTLIDGVTGSGKTEVYFTAIAEALEKEKQALVLVPEIALTSQWLEKFSKRFGTEPAQWHSDLSNSLRRETWRAVANGEIRVLVGARSALFLPFPELGLIVVDEEHETAFKQEEGVIYHARDMAVVRGHIAKSPVILASATPSLETLSNVETGKYDCVHLKERHAKALMPEIKLVDMRINTPEKGDWGMSWISPPLEKAVRHALENEEQAMLFLNRRGYAPLTLCRKCGYRISCPNCSAWLVEHRNQQKLQCHHCGYTSYTPEKCPECEAEDSFAACGPGVERIAEEAAGRFPDARISMITSDTISSPAVAAKAMSNIEQRKTDIIIGTQVLAKGHHFPFLTLVGVIDADLGLSGGDLRAGEKTFQLLNQVAGRAGREQRSGRVFIQTYDTEHSVMQALISGQRENFLSAEKHERKVLCMPPFGKMAALIVSGKNETDVLKTAGMLARTAPSIKGTTVLGPVPAPMSFLRGKHRHRLLLKTAKDIKIQKVLYEWLAKVNKPYSVRIQVDIDPYTFF